MPDIDQDYLNRRVKQEAEAALHCESAKAAAAHVELAKRYLEQLNGSGAQPKSNSTPNPAG